MARISFYKDPDKKLVDPDLFSKIAEVKAKEISEEGFGKKNTRTQLRKFYDEVIDFKEKIESSEDFEKYQPYLYMLKSKAAYAEGRGHITEKFRVFLSACLDHVKSKEDLDVFATFFEAFMGFYKKYGN